MAATTEERTRDGALLRRLRDTTVHGGRSGGFGFYTGAHETTKRRTLQVIARVRSGRELSADLERAIAAGADAVEIEIESVEEDMKSVLEVIATTETPCGILVDGPLEEDITAETLEKIDWLHLFLTGPGRLLTKSGPTRVLSLSPDLPPARLPGLAVVPADIVVVDAPVGQTSNGAPLNVEMLLAIGTIGSASPAPTLLGPGFGVSPSDLTALRDLGVDGLIVSDKESLPLLIKAIEDL